jgi:hypothetical protein
MIAREAGSRRAAPTPANARPVIKTEIDGATAQMSDAAVKTAAPIMKMRRRP